MALWWRRKGGNGGAVELWEWKGSSNQQRPLGSGHWPLAVAVAGRQEAAASREDGPICKFGLCKGVFGVFKYRD